MTTESSQTVPPSQRMPATEDFPTGPAVGERFPDVSLRNQRNELIDLHERRAGRPALVVFQRSARW